MNNGLDKRRVIEAHLLDSEHYFQSLLKQAQGKGLLNDNDIERIEYECISLLAYKTERFTHGESSSVPVERAQGIMGSNLFTIGLWLKTFRHPDDAVTALKNEAIEEIYRKGSGQIDVLLAEIKETHASLLTELADIPNVFFRETAAGGIAGFLKLYYPEFAAQEIHITADYPVLLPMPRLAGAEFIREYLDCIYRENMFLRLFDERALHRLFRGYAGEYGECLFNLYEPAVSAAIGCVLTGGDVHSLDIIPPGAEYLQRRLRGMPQADIPAAVNKAIAELIRLLDCPAVLVDYIQSTAPIIVSNIQAAAREKVLDRVFALPAYSGSEQKISIIFGEKMDDKQYRSILAEIAECRYASDKAAIIKEHIKSLADLEDVLLDAGLAKDDMQPVFQSMSMPEIAALAKRHILVEPEDIAAQKEESLLLGKYLGEYISALPENMRNMVSAVSKAMENS